MHAEGRQHGQVNAAHILLTPHGAELRVPQGPPAASDHASDAKALGALIFEVLTGARPMPGTPEPWAPRVAGARSTSANIRARALQIARRFFTHADEGTHNWAKDSAELRLLAMQARQSQLAGKPRSGAGAGQTAEPRESGGASVIPERAAADAGGDPAAAETRPLPPPEERIEPAIPAEFLKPEEKPAPVAFDPDLPDYRRCPDCGSSDVHPSKPRTRMEKLAAIAFKIPLYRCHQCYHRWFLLFRIAVPCRMQKVHRRSF